MAKRKTTFNDLITVMHKLRQGCPWDKEQTHESLLKYLREETEEVVHAVKRKDWDNLEEELGDVLLQILFHSEIASERRAFTVHDVLRTLKQKLVRRHPHVFAKGKNREQLTAEEVKRRWAIIKAKEKKGKR